MKKSAVSSLLLVLLCTLSPAAQTPATRAPIPAASPHYGDAITHGREVVAKLMAARGLPGFSVAVARDGVVIWSEGFGFADVEQGVPVTPLTRFRLGSVSKTLTSAGVARLVQDGKLDLDVPIQRYVPSFPAKPWPITTRQLANHSAGIRHYLPKDFDGPLKGAPHFDSVKKGLTRLLVSHLAAGAEGSPVRDVAELLDHAVRIRRQAGRRYPRELVEVAVVKHDVGGAEVVGELFGRPGAEQHGRHARS